jgi:hypothetical protein
MAAHRQKQMVCKSFLARELALLGRQKAGIVVSRSFEIGSGVGKEAWEYS